LPGDGRPQFVRAEEAGERRVRAVVAVRPRGSVEILGLKVGGEDEASPDEAFEVVFVAVDRVEVFLVLVKGQE
jgi:hypothetical protein